MVENKIEDDFDLLELMIKKSLVERAKFPLDGPTRGFLENFCSELREIGLVGMIENQSRQINNLSGISYSPHQQIQYNLNKLVVEGQISDREKRVLSKAFNIIFDKPDMPLLPYEISVNDLDQTSFLVSELSGKEYSVPGIENAAVSEVLNNGYSFRIKENNYNYSQLHFYLRYVFCAKHVNFDEIDTIVEIGSGSGRAVELIKRMHPHITFHLYDIGPQLYVANRYLSAVMPEQLVEFDTSQEEKGKIHFHCHYEIDQLRPSGKVLNWNTLVFCILEKRNAKNYFDIIKKFSDWIYIAEPMTDLVSKIYDMKSPILRKDYVDFFSKKYVLIDEKKDAKPLGEIKMWGGVQQMLWTRKK